MGLWERGSGNNAGGAEIAIVCSPAIFRNTVWDQRHIVLEGSKHRMDQELKMPRHVAIILDGNGRWARAKGMPRNYGHVQGAKTVETDGILWDGCGQWTGIL